LELLKKKQEEGEENQPAAKAAPKNEEVTLLDDKKANAIQIMLKGLKVSAAEVKKALMELDTQILDIDKLQALSDNMPLPEDFALVKGYEGDKSKLGGAAKFVMEMASIYRCEQRVNALLFKAGFEERFKEVNDEIKSVKEATHGVRHNPNIIKLMEIILALGNYLNGTSPRGGIFGFKLNSVLKLMEIKSSNKKSTLLHYMVDYLEKKSPELLKLPSELEAVNGASKVSLTETLKNLKAIGTGLKSIETELKDANMDESFKKAMQSFYDEANKMLEELDKEGLKLQEDLKECLNFYGEKPNSEPDAFFSIWSRLFGWMDNAKAESEKRKIEEAKAEQKARFQEELRKKTGEQGGKAKGHLSSQIAKMKSGRGLSRRNLPVGGAPGPNPPGVMPGLPKFIGAKK